MVHLGWRMKVQEEIQGIWRDLRALGRVDEGAEAQGGLSSILPLQGMVRGETEPAGQCLAPGLGVTRGIFGVLDEELAHTTPGVCPSYTEHSRNVLTWAPPQPWHRVAKHLAQ